MTWKDLLRKRLGTDTTDRERDRLMGGDIDGIDEEDVIYDRDKGGSKDGSNAAEIIQENDPELYQKLESHFTKRHHTLMAYIPEDKHWDDFHWLEAFNKWGMDDGRFQELSEDVADFIESLGYTVYQVDAAAHNIYIRKIVRN